MKAKPNLRLLITGEMPDRAKCHQRSSRWLAGFWLSRATQDDQWDDLRFVTKRKPTESEINDMLFAWKVTKHVKSNAIVFAKDGSTVGIGAGQMSRVDAAHIAVHKRAISQQCRTGISRAQLVRLQRLMHFPVC